MARSGRSLPVRSRPADSPRRPTLSGVAWRTRGLGAAPALRGGAFVVVLATVAVAVGIVSVGLPDFAVPVALLVLAVGLVLTDPPLVLVLAVPATLLQARFAGILSISDVMLAAATVVALFIVRPQGMRSMQPVVWAGVVYLAAAVPTLILNPYAANVVEWFHEMVLVLGSLVVGFAIGRTGRADITFRIYVAACVFVGVWASVVAVGMIATGHLEPVYLPQLNKNTTGGMLCAAIVMVYARPPWMRLKPPAMWASMVFLTAGMLAAQSRQALVGALVGILVISLRRRQENGKFPKLAWIAAVPVLIFVTTLLNDQLDSGDQFNSAYQRLDWYRQTFDIWMHSPVFGVGLRWWYTSRFDAYFQPPNAELEVLSSVGVVGLAGFILMFIIAVVALWRINPVYGTVGVAVVLARFAQAQLDLYWVAGQASLLWIVAGICYGVLERDRRAGTEVFLHRPDTRRRAVPYRRSPTRRTA
jgi:polysaccharide biosynthesis protein PslJ